MASMRRRRKRAAANKAKREAQSGTDNATANASEDTAGQTLTQPLLADPRGLGNSERHAHILLVGKVMREQWVPDDMGKSVAALMADIAEDSSLRTTDRTAAARVVMAAAAIDARREQIEADSKRPQSVVNVFDRAQVLLQQLAETPAQIAQDAAPTSDPPPGEQSAS